MFLLSKTLPTSRARYWYMFSLGTVLLGLFGDVGLRVLHALKLLCWRSGLSLVAIEVK